jgi:AcrR family transcriptional regulator
MLAIVAERGYEAVTVRELARVARVSTRAFYQHYAGKEDCFLDAHQLVVRRLFESVEASRVGSCDHDERVSRGLAAIISGWGAEPNAARLMLIDAYAASPTTLEEARRAEGWIAWRTGVDPTVVAGLIGVVRSRMLNGHSRGLVDLVGELISWALSYRSGPRSHGLESPSLMTKTLRGSRGPDSTLTGDLAFLLSAAIKLAGTEGRETLTARRIAAAAGVSRKSFHTFFSSPEDCLLMALESSVRQTIAEADRASEEGATVAHRMYRAVACLSARTARDPAFADLGFGEIETYGVNGLRAQARLLRELGILIAKKVSPATSSEGLTLYAHAGALWSVLAMGDAAHRARQSAAKAYLTVAPFVDQIENARPQSLVAGPGHETVRHGGRRSTTAMDQ